MKKKSIIFSLLILAGGMFLSAAANNEKALELIKKGNESFKVHKNPGQAFSYFKQAADLASGNIKVDALLRTAYMSHLQGNRILAYENFIKEALVIDPEKKLDPTDYKGSFRQVFNDIKNSEKTAPQSVADRPQPFKNQKPLKTKTAKPFKYFLKVSYAMGMAGSDQNQSWTEPLYGENTEYSLVNKTAKSSSINLGFGYNFSKALGIGLGAIIYSSDLDATVGVSVPSPWVFDSPRTASGSYATTLKATIIYLDFIYKFNFNRFSLGLFAGPAYFNSSTDVINAIEIQDVFPNDTVTMSFTTEKIKSSSFGFTGGLDLNYFFSSHLGIFVGGRYLSGSSTFTPSSSKVPGIKFTVGGMTAGAGLVFRF